MPGSDHIQVPIAVLREIQSTLSSLRGDLDSVETGAAFITGVDDVDGHQFQEAVSGYFQEWKDPRRRLLDNVGKLGEVSGKIADVTAEYDDQAAAGFNDFAAQLRGEG